jgi:hypothetical protein
MQEHEEADNRQLARGDYWEIVSRIDRKTVIDRAKGNKVFQLALAKGDYHTARKIAKMLRRRITTSHLLQLLEINVNKGNLGEAQEVASALGRRLNDSQLRTILAACLKVNRKYWDGYPALRVALCLGNSLTIGEAKMIMRLCLRHGHSSAIFDAAALVGREPSVKELEAIVALEVKRGWAEFADQFARSYLRRSLRDDEKAIALSGCLKQGLLRSAIQIAAELGRRLTDAELQAILTKKGSYTGFCENLEKTVRDHLTDAQIQMVSSHLAEHGHIKELQDLRGRPADRGELDQAWRLAIKTGNPYFAHELSKLTGESISSELAEGLLCSAVRHGFIRCVVEAAKIAGREATINEVRKAVRNSERRKQRKSR